MSRRANDFYETAPWHVKALVDHLPEISGTVWCPCVGDGSLMKELRVERPDLTFVTNDFDPSKVADFHLDATKGVSWREMADARGYPDWVIDNPPFNVELDIAKCAYAYATKGVVLMARISFVEGTRSAKKNPRGPWLNDHPRIKQIALERYSFTGDGKSDSATTEWLVWAKVPIANPGGYTSFGYKP